ncbi:MAG TPA: RMD1 family protein [Ignavibacteriales bacterium]|nr:RMD1 family protein [Ignavibacteriales bacterium]
MVIKILAYQFCDSLNIKAIKKDFVATLIDASTFDLFYKYEDNGYILILEYGVVVFANIDAVDITRINHTLKIYQKNPLLEPLNEDYEVEDGSNNFIFKSDKVMVPEIDDNILRIIMLNVGQSVGLDYYSQITQELLDETTKINEYLAQKGKLLNSKKEIIKYLGKTMGIKNKIIDNIYILDAPDIAWEDDNLNKLHNGLRKVFEISTRFKELDYQLQIVIDNLHMITELINYKQGHLLEWIIIILIAFEIIKTFF